MRQKERKYMKVIQIGRVQVSKRNRTHFDFIKNMLPKHNFSASKILYVNLLLCVCGGGWVRREFPFFI